MKTFQPEGPRMTNRERPIPRHVQVARERMSAAEEALEFSDYARATKLLEEARNRASLAQAEVR